MHPQESGGFVEIERVHVEDSLSGQGANAGRGMRWLQATGSLGDLGVTNNAHDHEKYDGNNNQ